MGWGEEWKCFISNPDSLTFNRIKRFPKELLIISMGEPEDVKKSVTKDKVREIFFYTPYQTHLKTTNYRYSVTLENKIVVGYKDLN